MTTGFKCFQEYTAIRLHFKAPNYNYFHYNGSTTVKEETFLHHKDRFRFERIARAWPEPRELRLHFAVGYLTGKAKWAGDFNVDEAYQSTFARIARIEGLWHHLSNEFNELVTAENTNLKSCMIVQGRMTKLYQKNMEGSISDESLAVLENVGSVLTKWRDASVIGLDNLIKYSPFVWFDYSLFRDRLLSEYFHR